MKIGIYSGTFNPIHLGHIILGNYMLDFMNMDEVWYLVSPQNPLKEIDANFLSETLRMEMVKIALSDYPKLKASDYEFHLSRPSYTYLALQSLRDDFPQHDFHLIIGADNWQQFEKWENHLYILENFPIIVFRRFGFDRSEFDQVSGSRVEFPQTPIIDISSTFIRCLIKEQKEFRPYLSLNVANYIIKKNLYF